MVAGQCGSLIGCIYSETAHPKSAARVSIPASLPAVYAPWKTSPAPVESFTFTAKVFCVKKGRFHPRRQAREPKVTITTFLPCLFQISFRFTS